MWEGVAAPCGLFSEAGDGPHGDSAAPHGQLPEATPPNTVTWERGSELQHVHLGRDANILSYRSFQYGAADFKLGNKEK